MRKEFSTKWKASKQPRKQRKYKANMPLHLKHKLMSAHLSKELGAKYKRRSFPLKKGDTVKVTKGEFRGKTGKINIADLKKLRVAVEGLQKQKKDGTKVNVYFRPSNLIMTELNLEDKERDKALKRNMNKEAEK
jgi:large subunit ribosomal protein L24